MSPCIVFRSAAILILAASGRALGAQLSAAPPKVPMIVDVRTTVDGTTYIVPQALVCVGNASDPQAYGFRWTGNDGRATIDSVPFGVQVYVTADRSSGILGIGNVQGKRVNYVLKAAGAVLVMHLTATNAAGPNCQTAIGAEPVPPPTKVLPVPDTTVPALVRTLKTAPGPVSPSLLVQLYTDASSPNFLTVSGVPSSYAVSNTSSPNSLTWHAVTITGYDRMQAVNVTLPPGEGKKTVYFFLKNAKGTSPPYAVDVTYVDATPCILTLTRATGTAPGVPTTQQQYSITRGQSRAFTSDGTLTVSAANNGSHVLTIGYVSADAYGDEYGTAKEFTIGPGSASSWGAFRSVKYATCP